MGCEESFVCGIFLETGASPKFRELLNETQISRQTNLLVRKYLVQSFPKFSFLQNNTTC